MKTYNKIDKNVANKSNQKQSVLIETVTENEKTVTKVYMANCKKRSNVYNDIYVEQGMKPSKKKDAIQKSYRILKLHKLMEALKGVDLKKEKYEWYQVEGYSEEVPAKTEEPATEVVEEVEAEAVEEA